MSEARDKVWETKASNAKYLSYKQRQAEEKKVIRLSTAGKGRRSGGSNNSPAFSLLLQVSSV